MFKTMFKELGIIILLLIAIGLVFVMVFYDYNTINTTIPKKVEAYELQSDVREELEETLKAIEGRQKQRPPIYSAIKIKGKKLYEYARKNEVVEIPEREIEIYSMQLLSYNQDEKTISFRVHCSKGTYIRSLCEDIAKKLDTVGYMKELKRIQVGEFNIENSITIEKLEKNIDNKEYINNKIISIENLFKDNEKIVLEQRKLTLFLNGVKLTQNYKDGIYKIYDTDKNFIGIGTIKERLLKRDIII